MSQYASAKHTWATIAYGSRIKLHHSATATVLHSHPYFYGHPGTSGQQQVTAFAGNDGNDWWTVKGPHGTPDDYRSGQPVKHGDVIRLEHQPTRRNLHSHGGVPSPITLQQEVTCFGENGQGDDNDNWQVELEAGGNWDTGKQLRLIHANTNHVLHSHAGFSHPDWTLNQQEVTCFAGRDGNDWWSVIPFLISTISYEYSSLPTVGQPLDEPQIEFQPEVETIWHEVYVQVGIPDNEDISLPVVMLLHGASGDIFHMSDPARSPGFNYDRQAPAEPNRDLGWHTKPGSGVHSSELAPLKPVTSWQTALNNAGFRTINYGQINPRGLLGLPIDQLSQLLGDVMNHPHHQGRQFVLLGHSRGGLLARALVAQPAEERKFDLMRIQQIITLHSPHRGSKVATLATELTKAVSSLREFPSFIYKNYFQEFVESVEGEAGAAVYYELRPDSNFLKQLRTREPIPGIQYATFGGNSTVLSRCRFWKYTPSSQIKHNRRSSKKFHWQTFPEDVDLTPENAPKFVLSGELPEYDETEPKNLPLPPELKNGSGDLLVTAFSSSLPWVPHRVNPINHAEALWDPNLQQQVIELLRAEVAAANAQITYGSRIKLRHFATNKGLHSHPHSYSHPGTSGQQQVTAFERTDDNDWWIVKGPHGEPDHYRAGQPVQQGDVIRLEHVLTRKNLHSHSGTPSPITGQQEVTCCGENGQGDDNDNWRVELETGSSWQRSRQFRLIHANTQQVLRSTPGSSHPQWTLGQQEVTCAGSRDNLSRWSVFVISGPLELEKPTVIDESVHDEVFTISPKLEDRPAVYQP